MKIYRDQIRTGRTNRCSKGRNPIHDYVDSVARAAPASSEVFVTLSARGHHCANHSRIPFAQSNGSPFPPRKPVNREANKNPGKLNPVKVPKSQAFHKVTSGPRSLIADNFPAHSSKNRQSGRFRQAELLFHLQMWRFAGEKQRLPARPLAVGREIGCSSSRRLPFLGSFTPSVAEFCSPSVASPSRLFQVGSLGAAPGDQQKVGDQQKPCGEKRIQVEPIIHKTG